MPNPRQAAILIILALAALLMYRDFAGFYNEERAIPQDFRVYQDAAQKARAGENPYSAATFLVYKYAPGILPVLMALPEHAGLSWNIYKLLNTLLIAIVLWLIGSGYRSWRNFWLLCLGIVLTYKGIIEVLAIGQVEFFLLASTTVAIMTCRKWPFLSGVLMAWLIAIKLPWGFFILPVSLYAYNIGLPTLGSLCKGFLLGLLFWFILLPFAFFGVDTTVYYTREWLRVLKEQPSELMYNPGWNQSLFVFFNTKFEFLPHAFNVGLSIILSIATAGGMAYVAFRRSMKNFKSEHPVAWLTPWYIVGLLINPLAWRWGTAALVAFPFALAGRTLIQRKNSRIILWILLGVSFVLQRSWAEFFFTDFDPMSNGILTIYWILLFLLIA